jgi:hypothetical protein
MAHEARQHRPDPIGQFEEMATTAANRILMALPSVGTHTA